MSCILKSHLLAQDGLAASRDPDDEIDGVLEQAAVQDRVELLVSGRQPIGQDDAGRF